MKANEFLKDLRIENDIQFDNAERPYPLDQLLNAFAAQIIEEVREKASERKFWRNGEVVGFDDLKL